MVLRHRATQRSSSESGIIMQAYYMAAPFAVERAPTVALCCPLKYRTVHVALLKDYPVSTIPRHTCSKLHFLCELPTLLSCSCCTCASYQAVGILCSAEEQMV